MQHTSYAKDEFAELLNNQSLQLEFSKWQKFAESVIFG